MRDWLRTLFLTLTLLVCPYLRAQLPPATAEKIDTIATKALADSGTHVVV